MKHRFITINTRFATALLLALAAMLPAAISTDAARPQAKASADKIMNRAAAAFDTAPALDIDFYIMAKDSPLKSKLHMAKCAFAMTTPMVNVWFDGKTQWTMLNESREVSITEPTTAELMESNPFSIVRYYSSKYKARRLEDRNGFERVELTPLESNRTASIKRAVLSFDPKTGLPSAAEVTFTNGSAMRASVEKCTHTKKQDISAFRYDSKKFPANEIIDLR